MKTQAFFKEIYEQFQNGKPFAVYKKPDSNSLTAFLQQNNKLYHTTDFREEGFIFAPFNSEENTIIIPLKHSERFGQELDEDFYELQHDFEEINKTIHTKDKQQYIQLLNETINQIKTTGIKKIVLSRKEVIDTPSINPIDALKVLIKMYKTAFVSCFYHPKVGLWLGATPEVLLKVENGMFKAMALAGTQKVIKDKTPKWEPKETIEHQYVINDITENLQNFAKVLMVSKSYSDRAGSIWHLRTDITGTLINKTCTIQNILKTLHPTPAVCGLPAHEVKDYILNNEGYDREFYTGFLGEVKIDKLCTHLFVNLRCMKIDADTVTLFVGGGITEDSIAENEWQETVNKSHTMKRVLHYIDKSVFNQ